MLGHPAGDTAVNEKIGFLPEESYLYRFLNGEEILRFYGKLFKIDRKTLNKRVPMLLDTVGLDAKSRKRKLREYSKGMARRIGLAQAMINDPDLILLDEPTTGLDPIGTREMKDLILSLKAQGKTVLLCSHLLADVQDVCDRITILFRGQMMELAKGADGRAMLIAPVKDVLAGQGCLDRRSARDERAADRTVAAVHPADGRERRASHAPDDDAGRPVHANRPRKYPAGRVDGRVETAVRNCRLPIANLPIEKRSLLFNGQ